MSKSRVRLTFCKGDSFILIMIAILALLTGICFWFFAGNQKGSQAVIYKNGEIEASLSLDEDAEISITNYYTNKIIVKDGRVSIIASDCPGADCVHSGWIKEGGRSIVCLPNRVEIRIEGEADSEVDFMVR